MNSIISFLQIPLVRIIGVIAVLYLALFSNKEKPDSLGNRLSKDEIVKNFNQVKERTNFITTTIQSNGQAQVQKSEGPQIVIEDIELGTGDISIGCGMGAKISYSIFDQSGNQLKNSREEKVVVGSKLNKFLEDNIIGMKNGAIRNIKVPKDFLSDDQTIDQLLKFYKNDLRFQIMVTELNESQEGSNTQCNL